MSNKRKVLVVGVDKSPIFLAHTSCTGDPALVVANYIVHGLSFFYSISN